MKNDTKLRGCLCIWHFQINLTQEDEHLITLNPTSSPSFTLFFNLRSKNSSPSSAISLRRSRRSPTYKKWEEKTEKAPIKPKPESPGTHLIRAGACSLKAESYLIGPFTILLLQEVLVFFFFLNHLYILLNLNCNCLFI